jgi:hypothetical protein
MSDQTTTTVYGFGSGSSFETATGSREEARQTVIARRRSRRGGTFVQGHRSYRGDDQQVSITARRADTGQIDPVESARITAAQVPTKTADLSDTSFSQTLINRAKNKLTDEVPSEQDTSRFAQSVRRQEMQEEKFNTFFDRSISGAESTGVFNFVPGNAKLLATVGKGLYSAGSETVGFTERSFYGTKQDPFAGFKRSFKTRPVESTFAAANIALGVSSVTKQALNQPVRATFTGTVSDDVARGTIKTQTRGQAIKSSLNKFGRKYLGETANYFDDTSRSFKFATKTKSLGNLVNLNLNTGKSVYFKNLDVSGGITSLPSQSLGGSQSAYTYVDDFGQATDDITKATYRLTGSRGATGFAQTTKQGVKTGRSTFESIGLTNLEKGSTAITGVSTTSNVKVPFTGYLKPVSGGGFSSSGSSLKSLTDTKTIKATSLEVSKEIGKLTTSTKLKPFVASKGGLESTGIKTSTKSKPGFTTQPFGEVTTKSYVIEPDKKTSFQTGISIGAQDTKQKFKSSGGSASIQSSVLDLGTKEDTVLKSDLITLPAQDSSLRTRTTPKTTTITSQFSTFDFPTIKTNIITTPSLPVIPLGGGSSFFKKPSKSKKSKKKYSPTLFASSINLRGKKSRVGTLSGLGARRY